jgi:integrase
MTIDIHSFEKQWQQALANFERLPISERNKRFVRAYCDACLVRQVCGKVRLIRVVIIMGLLARQLGKDFDQVTREDIEVLFASLLRHEPPYSVVTISTYKKVLRRFLSYVFAPNDFPHVKTLPESIAWINGHIRRREQPEIQRSELLTPEEIERLLRVATCARDRAFIATLWEAGPRVSEIGNMQLKHATRVENGYRIDITGKTGNRSPLVVSSAPYLSAWLASHPAANDPEAPLWVQHHSNRAMTYDAFARSLQRLFKMAGITKPCHPHIFRHSRVTYVLANAIMNEQQAKTYFGWTPESDVIGSTYAHLTDSDANNAILRENNLAPHQQAHRDLEPIACRICAEMNPPKSDYCQRCHAVLNLSKAYEHQQLHDLKEELFTQMFKVMVEKGLIDEAAGAIHTAGLGTTLKRLALHVSGAQNIASNTASVPQASVKQEPPPRETNPVM